MNLICFPYAGSTSFNFYKWKDSLDCRINIIPIELPGRGSRGKEQLCESIDEAIDSFFSNLLEVIQLNDYAIYGHSMGTLFVYETIKRLQNMNMKLPKHIFLSGRLPPHIIDFNNHGTPLNNKEFIDFLVSTKSYSEEFLNSDLFKNYFLPVVRADFKIVEAYQFKEEKIDFNTDLTFLLAENDLWVNSIESLEWSRYTGARFDIVNQAGGHMFLMENSEEVTSLINKVLIEKMSV